MTGRVHGRAGSVYMNLGSAGAISQVAFLNSWTINFTTDKAEVTAFGDNNKVYMAGLPDSQGGFDGFYDDSTVQTYTAASDGIARTMALYPSLLKATQYFYGSILPDFSASGDVGGAVAIKCTWSAAGNIVKFG